MSTVSVLQGADHAVVTNSTINAANVIHTHHYYSAQMAAAGGNITVAPVTSTKPNSSALFTGRKDILEKLKNHFIPRSAGDNIAGRRSFLIYGMGGIGKTQICLKFIEQMEDTFSQVFWVDASTEGTISLSLKSIANNAGREDSSESGILRWIGSLKGNWLLIFDNADLEPEVVEKFIPPGQRGNILISSRNGSLRCLTTSRNSFELHEMEEAEAISFLLKAAFLDDPTSSDQQFAKAIVAELYCLPLAVGQAGSSIASGVCSISGYLKLYSLKSKELLSDPHFKGASKYGRTVYGTWELSFQEIQRRADSGSQEAKIAIVILKTFAFCHYNNIGEEIFERAALNALNWNLKEDIDIKLPQIRKVLDFTLLEIDHNGQWDSLKFKHSIRLLLSFSLIKLGACDTSFSVHPLVHAWSRDRLSISEQLIQSKLTVALLSSSIAWEQGLNDMMFRRSLLPHITKHFEATGKLNMFESYYDDEYTNFGLVFTEGGYWRHALKLRSKIFEMRSTILGKEHQITLQAMQNLANTYHNLGNFAKAEMMKIQALEMSKKLHGEEHPKTIMGMNNLAITYSSLGKFTEAKKLQVHVLEMSKRLLGEENPETMKRMQNLANTYQNLGRLIEAEKLKVQVLDMSKRLLGEEHPETLKRMQNLAVTYNSLRKFADAEKLAIQVLDMSKRLLGEEHPETMKRMQNLAVTYHRLNRLAEAENLLVQVLNMSKRLLGEEHPDTIGRMHNLAITHLCVGRFAEAEKLQVEVLDMSKRLLGDEHPDTLKSMQSLALTYQSLERFSEAETLQVAVLNMSQRLLGDQHPDTLRSMKSLATTYQNLGRFAEAEKLEFQFLLMS